MRFLQIIGEVTQDAFYSITYFFKSNLITFANILNLIVPYLMYVIGQDIALDREEFAIGSEVLIPIIFMILIFYLKSTANKIGKGVTIPVPDKRFTEVDDYGEVSIENNRIQELILYVADLEDWLERKGML